MTWTVETLNETVDKELESLPVEMLARFVHITRLLEDFGPRHVREPHVKHIGGKLYEMRMRGKAGISRALYITTNTWWLFGYSWRKRRKHTTERSNWR